MRSPKKFQEVSRNHADEDCDAGPVLHEGAECCCSVNTIAHFLLSNGLSGSREEAECIGALVMEEIMTAKNDDERISVFEDYLRDYFSVSENEIRDLVVRHGLPSVLNIPTTQDKVHTKGNTKTNAEQAEWREADFIATTETDDEEEIVGEGDCELCERTIQLTKHHLIPKSTWPRIFPQLFHAAKALQDNDLQKARSILGDGLGRFQNDLAHADRAAIRQILGRTCNVCRPCHSAIHNIHNNMTLATQYNTVDALIQDESIYKFCKWASRQRTGKYARNVKI
jgi:hypothetical protein